MNCKDTKLVVKISAEAKQGGDYSRSTLAHAQREFGMAEMTSEQIENKLDVMLASARKELSDALAVVVNRTADEEKLTEAVD